VLESQFNQTNKSLTPGGTDEG